MTVPFTGDGTRYCTHCQTRNRAIEDGYWKLTRGGLHKRWICGACVSRVRARSLERQAGDATGRQASGEPVGGVPGVDRSEMGHDAS
jgi:hypothetical protein